MLDVVTLRRVGDEVHVVNAPREADFVVELLQAEGEWIERRGDVLLLRTVPPLQYRLVGPRGAPVVHGIRIDEGDDAGD